MEMIKVYYTNQEHFDYGMYDLTEQEKEEKTKKHTGLLLGWASESRMGINSQYEIIVVGIIYDEELKQLKTIPINRIQIDAEQFNTI